MDAETVDYVAVRRLQDAYADIVTRREWGELAEIFLPDVHRRLEGRWWLAERRYHTLARTGRAVDTFAFPAGENW